MCYLKMKSLFSRAAVREITNVTIPFVDPLIAISECSDLHLQSKGELLHCFQWLKMRHIGLK